RVLFRSALLDRLAELVGQPRAQLREAIVGVEDAPHDELRCARAVPAVLFEAEGDVVGALAPEAVERRPLAERDRAAGVEAVLPDAEAQVLPLTHRRELGELAPGREQRHLRIAEAERREPRELSAEIERQLLPARENRVDAR